MNNIIIDLHSENNSPLINQQTMSPCYYCSNINCTCHPPEYTLINRNYIKPRCCILIVFIMLILLTFIIFIYIYYFQYGQRF